MSILLIAVILVLTLNIILGILVFVRSKHSLQNILFILIIFLTSFWILFDTLTDISTDFDSSFLFAKLTFIGPVLIPVLLIFFILKFSGLNKISKKWYFILVPTVLFIVLLPTNLILESITKNPTSGFKDFQYGVIYPFFAVYIFLAFGIGIGTLVYHYRKSKGISKIQFRYLIF